MINMFLSWPTLHLLLSFLAQQVEGKLQRVYIPANNLTLNPLRVSEDGVIQVFDFNDLSDIQMLITLHPGRCWKDSMAHVIIITFLDHWYPPDLMQHMQLLNNAIVLQKVDYVKDSSSVVLGQRATVYSTFATDPGEPYSEVNYTQGNVSFSFPKDQSVFFNETTVSVRLTLSRPTSSLGIVHGLPAQDADADVINILETKKTGNESEQEDSNETLSQGSNIEMEERFNISELLQMDPPFIKVNTKNTRYFFISATEMLSCPTYISKMTKHVYRWTLESPLNVKGVEKKQRERITVLRDVIIACITIICYLFALNYVFLPLYFHIFMPLPKVSLNQDQQHETEGISPMESGSNIATTNMDANAGQQKKFAAESPAKNQ